MIKLYDRVKEKVYTIGTGNFALSGVFSGFVSFGSVYQNGDSFFYVANDGFRYEVGSGVYVSSSNEIQRFPIKSSNSNNKVNFPEGLKEVYVNYPATNSVFNGSGIDLLPVNSGLAFWTSSNSLSSDNNFYIDSGNHRVGLNQSNPIAAIDVGGSLEYSKIRSSGFIVGKSGIYFPPNNDGDADYLGGQQLVHFEKNELDLIPYNEELIDEYTGLANVIQLSGNVNQYFLLKKQNAGMFFAGPVSGCSPPCEPNYPTFRYIDPTDVPDLSDIYASKDYVDSLTFPTPTISETNQYNGGRLSLSNSDPVNINTTTENDTIYFVPYTSNLISLWNGSAWEIKQFSASSVIDTYSPLDLNTVYDIFAEIDSNDISFSITSWEDFDVRDSSNINVLQFYDGILCKKGNKGKRYIGSFAYKSSGPFYDSPEKRLLFNAYNQVDKIVCSESPESSVNWIYEGTTFAAITQVSPVEILNGNLYDSNGDFDTSNTLNLGLSVIFYEAEASQKGYILGIASAYPDTDYIDITSSDIKNNEYIKTNLDYINEEYNDTILKTLTSNLVNVNNRGWVKYYGIQKNTTVSMNSTLRITNLVNSGGVNGVINGSWRC